MNCNGKGRQQSTKSSKNGGGSDSGGQEAPGKRREAGALAAAAAAGAAGAAGVAAVAAMAGVLVGRGQRQEWRLGFRIHTWRQFGAHKSDASSECVSGPIPMFGV